MRGLAMVWLRIEVRSDHNHGSFHAAPTNFVRASKDYILSADEKTSIQARARVPPPLACEPGRPTRVEPEYRRGGAWQYLAAWDVRRGYVMGRCEAKTGIAPFGRLVEQVLAVEP